MNYVIETNVPCPSPRGRGSKPKYPFAEMKVGDSFLATDSTAKQVGMAAVCWAKHHKNGFKFSCRTLPDGARCWRVE